MFTIPESGFDPDQIPDSIQYVKGQLEVGHETGYRHWQLLIVFKRSNPSIQLDEFLEEIGTESSQYQNVLMNTVGKKTLESMELSSNMESSCCEGMKQKTGSESGPLLKKARLNKSPRILEYVIIAHSAPLLQILADQLRLSAPFMSTMVHRELASLEEPGTKPVLMLT